MLIEKKYSRIQKVNLPELAKKNIAFFVKREDELHPKISGNKYRKLAYNIEEAKKLGKDCLVTFGGAFSNHILATAAAGNEFGFKTIGVIRGDELANDLNKTLSSNETLRTAKELGMQFKFVSRSNYRLKSTPEFLENIEREFSNCYILPEGGTNDLAIKGCEEILDSKDFQYDYICLAVGTGGTISGVINSSSANQKIIGFPALKGDFLFDEIKNNQVNKENWTLNTDYHFGGYAKINTELIHFINQFYKNTNIPLDPVYTGKLFFGLFDLIEKGYFSEDSKILLIHTGGLQGIKGMNELLKRKNLPLIIE